MEMNMIHQTAATTGDDVLHHIKIVCYNFFWIGNKINEPNDSIKHHRHRQLFIK